MKKVLMMLSAVAMIAPSLVATTPAEAKRVYREWTGKDGKRYCSRSDGTVGVIAGGVGGALLGRAIDTRGDRTIGTLGGAALGALAGREIDRSTSKRRCQ